MTIGERIYYCRTENHMTQKELGEKTGIASATIGKYERGVLNPKISTLRKIADALGCDVSDLDNSLSGPVDNSAVAAVVEAVNSMVGHNSAVSAALEAVSQNENSSLTPELKAKILSAYQAAAKNKPMSKEEQLLQNFRGLNDDGQSVAVDRVEELAQIPKYQRTQSAPQDAPTDADDKTPVEK